VGSPELWSGRRAGNRREWFFNGSGGPGGANWTRSLMSLFCHLSLSLFFFKKEFLFSLRLRVLMQSSNKFRCLTLADEPAWTMWRKKIRCLDHVKTEKTLGMIPSWFSLVRFLLTEVHGTVLLLLAYC
jgi:hypothetical protein